MLRPLLDGSHGIAYLKAFYRRISLETTEMQGRATRLFVGPMMVSLKKILCPLPYLSNMHSFSLPLGW
jgi:hypothetical protein